jgi:hypothetical protein
MIARMAVLVDGDNISAAHAAEILKIATQRGIPDVVRVYTDAQRPSDWHGATGYRMIHAGCGKNAADVLLAIDAMELALSGGFRAFLIASSDRDFLHVLQRLREYGAVVTGVGEAKAPHSFRSACSSFIQIGKVPVVKPVVPAVQSAPDPVSAPNDIDQNIRQMIAAHSKNGEGMRITDLNARMRVEHGVLISTHKERNWRTYLTARPNLYDVDARGPDAKVRFRPGGFSSAR